ncbi:Hypothetical predicted protein [Marmota monax]|uniref:Uncharacterized protein n=1 Tax=Marmota monax TaxID=9995 RepID=A0A5E4ARB8_MARMO|nr:hypothetical protein GHT09_002211 [Marmota monax]VTJ59316.1 Hypothetical predicted protein [Marmota monax]
MGQPPRGELGPPSLPQRFAQPDVPFGPSPLQRPGQGLPSLPPNTSPFPGPDPGFPGPGAAAVNGNQPSFPPNSSGRGDGTLDANSLAPPGKTGGGSGPQPPPGLVYPCGACRNETKEIQSVYIREGMGQLVAANDG